MNQVVTDLALKYAQALTEFHFLETHANESGLCEDLYKFRDARDELYDAQNALDAAARMLATSNDYYR